MLKKLFRKEDEKTNEQIKKLENRIEKIELELKTIKNTSSYSQVIRIEKELQQIKTEVRKLTIQYTNLKPKPNTIEQTKQKIIQILKQEQPLQTKELLEKLNIKSRNTIYKALKQLQKEKKITKTTVKEDSKRKVYYKLVDENTDYL